VISGLNDNELHSETLAFIKNCVQKKRVVWTYHVNIRMADRFISRSIILNSHESYEIIEAYPQDKYLPSYLIYSTSDDLVFHILFAVDTQNKNVRIVTAYTPDPKLWSKDFKRREKT